MHGFGKCATKSMKSNCSCSRFLARISAKLFGCDIAIITNDLAETLGNFKSYLLRFSESISDQGCGAGVIRNRRFLGVVGFLTTLGVGVGFFSPTPTPDVQLDHFCIILLTWEFLFKWYNFL